MRGAVALGDGGSVTTLRYEAYDSATPKGAKPTLVLAHGAGADQASGFLVAASEGLAARGITTVTFNFGYTEAKRRRPDPPKVLEACWRAVHRAVAEGAKGPLFVGGKSMGGRMASQVAAAGGFPGVEGLVFFGYPLHPAKEPAKRRDAHLPQVPIPMLFVQGTRDALGTAEDIEALFPRLQAPTLHAVEGADHGFDVLASVRKARGVTQADVMTAILDGVAAWVVATSRSSLSA